MDAVYPGGANNESVSGAASMKCFLAADGGLRDCRLLTEQPKGYGFGTAFLKLSPRFRLDMTKSPNARGGQSFVLTMRFLIPGAVNAVASNLQPGSAASVVTVVHATLPKDAVTVPCPSRSDAERKCQFHAFEWATLPTWERSDALLSGSDQSTGTALMECKVGAAGELTACKAGGASTRNQAALLELAKDFRAPAKAIDGAPIAGERVVLKFDWALVAELKGYRAPNLFAPPAPASKRGKPD